MTELQNILIKIILEYLKYILVYYVVLNAHMKQKRGILFLFLLGHLFLQGGICLKYGYELGDTLLLVLGISIPFFVFEGNCRWKIASYIPVVMGISIFDMLCSMIVGIVAEGNVILSDRKNILFSVTNGISLLFLLIIYCWKKSGKRAYHKVVLRPAQYSIILLGIVSCFWIMTLLQVQIAGYEFNEKMKMLFYGSCGVAGCAYILLSIYQIITMNQMEIYREQSRNYEAHLQNQREYAKKILEKNEQERRFRHDIRGHISAIEGLCKAEKNEEITSYIATMKEKSGLYEKDNYTGNVAVDAIINDLKGEMDKEEISFAVTGVLGNGCRVEEYDLCSVVYNLLQNAIEGNKAVEKGKRYIIVDFWIYNYRMHICVKNSVAKKVKIEGEIIETTKADKEHHGFGMRNVKEIAEKYMGITEYECSDKEFVARVLL
ncbi:MAG: GHKL domain-containing protein [Lachnospiraceae bacterium]|nr:GHKL domain-containing protein [Lachnospiraceae bacterium]